MSMPSFSVLWANYPMPAAHPRDRLYRSLGWDDIVDDPQYVNTCAIRLSIALLRSGVSIPRGELKIWKGPLKNKRVLIRYDGLAKYLKKIWGDPHVMATPTKADLYARGDGVVAFFGLPSGYPGHIDLLDVTKTTYQLIWRRMTITSGATGLGLYDLSREVWHWSSPTVTMRSTAG